MNDSHLDGAENIEKICFSRPWSRQSLKSELNNENSRFFAAVEDGEVLGYASMSVILDEGYIFNIAVLPQSRRRGVGSALLGALLDEGKKRKLRFITLEVRKSSLPAVSMYLKFGFSKVGERKNYYSSPTEDAVLMTRFFAGEDRNIGETK